VAISKRILKSSYLTCKVILEEEKQNMSFLNQDDMGRKKHKLKENAGGGERQRRGRIRLKEGEK